MKSIVLLSGGLDSAVNLANAVKNGEVKLCLTFDYGQRAAAQEITHAEKLSKHFDADHKVLRLEFFNCFRSALTSDKIPIPEIDKESLDDLQITKETAKSVWVPNRNGIFINIAAAFAENIGADTVITGFNAEEAKTFLDNSEEYVLAINKALQYSTSNGVRVISYTQRLNKEEIVCLGKRLNVPWDYIWGCYYGGTKMCGRCESCMRYFRSLECAGVKPNEVGALKID